MSHSTSFGRRAAVAALSLVLALSGLAACGDDDSVAADDTTTTTVEADDTTTTADTEATSTTETTSETPSGSSGSFCIDVAAFDSVLESLDDEYDSNDPEDLTRGFSAILGPMRAIDVPGEIEADWALMVTAFTDLSEAFGRIDFSRDDVDEQFAAVGAALEEEFDGIEEAGERVEAYVLDECDVDLGD